MLLLGVAVVAVAAAAVWGVKEHVSGSLMWSG